MPNTPILALPYPVLTDTADVPRDIQALATKLDGITGIAPPLVSSLPGSPVDGQEILYQADAANGVIWHLRYRAASASTYKWEFIGGPPLSRTNGTTDGVTVTAVTLLPGSPTLPALPFAGDYAFQLSAQMRNTVASAWTQVTLMRGSAAAPAPGAVILIGNAGTAPGVNTTLATMTVIPGLTAGDVIGLGGNVSSGGNGAVAAKHLWATPVRVG